MNEWQAGGWVPDLPLTPFQSDHDHIFKHNLHAGITISNAHLGFYLISHQSCGESNYRIKCLVFWKGDWGSEVSCALNKVEPLESENPWAWSLGAVLRTPSPYLPGSHSPTWLNFLSSKVMISSVLLLGTSLWFPDILVWTCFLITYSISSWCIYQ